MVKRLVIVLSILVGLVSICISGCETQEQEVKKLIKALQHKNSQVRHAAAAELGKLLCLLPYTEAFWMSVVSMS